MIKTESNLMRFFRAMGMDGIAWSLRRLHCPVDKDALVLEVGSGGNPYARANVLLDAYENTRERHWAPLVADRPTVLGFVEKLPFKDKAFDFVIASHVLEHSADPVRFLSELQRVARAGYIEVPDAFLERINPYRDHRLEITNRDNKLVIRKKKSWVVDNEAVELYEHAVKKVLTANLVPKHPFAFHTRYYWRDTIEYTIVNPDAPTSWEADSPDLKKAHPVSTLKTRVHTVLLGLFRFLFSQNRRNKKIDLLSLLACPACKSPKLSETTDGLTCGDCNEKYATRNGIPVFS